MTGFTLTGGPALKRRLAAIGEAPRKILNDVGVSAVQEAKALVPRKTGNLGRTIRVSSISSDHVEVSAGGSRDVGYAAAVEFGSRAHIIVPKTQSVRYAGPFLRGQKGQRRGGVLAWGGARTLGGRLRKGARPEFFARRVNHPGTRARPFLIPGMERAIEIVGLGSVIDAWNRAS